MDRKIFTTASAITLVWLFMLSTCYKPAPDDLVLYDFEIDASLDLIQWKCFILFRLLNERVAHGSKSLMIELYPSSYPGWMPILHKKLAKL